MRKIALMLLMLLLAVPSAHAESLPFAARPDMHAQFERYQGYKMDDATGDWSAHGLIAGQMLSAVEQGDASGYMSDGVCVLYPGVRGNRDLSLMEPVLFVCLLRSSSIKADALSIATGGARYDFVGKAEETKIGERKCERFALPLDEEGLALLRRFADEGAEVRIYGETRIFRTSIREAEKYKSSKLRVEAMSVAAARDFLPLWPDDYALWDLNLAHWEQDRPKMAVVALESGYADDLPALEPATGCLDAQKGSQVKAYQQLLKDQAFFTAKLASNYGKSTRASTKQAQQYYGLLPTGMADRSLIELLNGAPQKAAAAKAPGPAAQLTDAILQAIPGVAYALTGQVSIRIDRAWAARSLSPSRSSDMLERISPTDRSNRLYIADGEIANLSDNAAQLPSLLTGYVQVGDARYPCIIQCERDEGRSFGTALLAMGKSRLVVACVVPEGIELSPCELHLTIQGAAQKIEISYDLEAH